MAHPPRHLRSAALAALFVLPAGCSAPATVTVGGNVDTVTHVVAAPPVPAPGIRITNASPLGAIVAVGDPVVLLEDAVQAAAPWSTDDLTTLDAPVAGTVVATSMPGDVVGPGSPVLAIRPDAPPPVTVWVAPDVTPCVGAPATVTTDWGGTHAATVGHVGVRAEYPPTERATDEVHLTRAVPVTLDLTDHLPPGAPVDAILTPCHQEP